MDRRTIGTKNPGRCGEVAAIERWLLVEVQLYADILHRACAPLPEVGAIRANQLVSLRRIQGRYNK